MIAFDGYEMKFKFNASHFIDYSKPETAHTHTFHIVCYIKNDNQNFVSYTTIERNIEDYLSVYKGKCLNFIRPFDKIVPTLENFCKEIYKTIDDYCESINVDLYKLSISDNSVFWYSLGDYVLIDSLNETIPIERVNTYIDEIRQINIQNVVQKTQRTIPKTQPTNIISPKPVKREKELTLVEEENLANRLLENYLANLTK